MARQKNDGRGRMGGRAKGTPNKATTNIKQWISSIVDGNREQFEKDLEKLPPSSRIRVITDLLPFVTPKFSSISAQEAFEAEYKKLQELLESAPDNVLDEIVERIERLKNGQEAED